MHIFVFCYNFEALVFLFQILQDRVLSSQARKDEYEEQRLRKSLTKLSNHCTVSQLSEFISSAESGTETDNDPFSSPRHSGRDDIRSESDMSSSYDIIEMDADSLQGTPSPLGNGDIDNEYDVISSGNEDDVITVKGQKMTKKNVNNAQNVKNARDRLQITDDDGISNSLAFFGKSDSSDTLINDSDSDSDLDELVRKNQLVKTSTKKLDAKNKNVSNEIISRTSAGKLHAQKTDSDSSADRTLRNSNFSDDITITLTSPNNETKDVFSPDLTAQRDENKNVIQSSRNNNNLTINDNDVQENIVEAQDTSAIINDELQELKSLESPRHRTVARDIVEKFGTEGSGSDGEVHEEIIRKSQVNTSQNCFSIAHL